MQLKLFYILNPLQYLSECGIAMVDYFKITEADRLLCLPSNTAPPIISSTWLINISIPVVAPFPIAEGSRDIPLLPSVLQTPLLTKQKAQRSVAEANNSRAAYLLRRDRISACPRRRLPRGRSAAAPGLCVVSSAGPHPTCQLQQLLPPPSSGRMKSSPAPGRIATFRASRGGRGTSPGCGDRLLETALNDRYPSRC